MDKGLSHWADLLVIVLYFCAILAVGIWTIFKPHGRDVQTYFLAGRNMPWFAVGASMFAANIGPEVFVGLAGGGAVGGISLVLYEWFPIFIILMLSWIFLPVFISAQVYTLPEYMERRYGGKRLRLYLSCLSITVNTVSKLATCMFSGTLFLQLVLDWNMYISLAVLILVTMAFTTLGGLKAVIYVGTFQTAMMVIGAVCVMVISRFCPRWVDTPTWNNNTSVPSRVISPTPRRHVGSRGRTPFTYSRAHHQGTSPGLGSFYEASIGEVALWGCNQAVVQRAISARSLSHAKGGTLLLGVLKLLPLFLMILPGMISRVLFTDEVACATPVACEAFCDNPVGCSNMAYPMLITELLPVGLRGLLLAIMVSAIMTSLTAVFSSESTVFTMDIWRTVRPGAKERELLIVGKLFTLVTCVIAVGFVPLVKVFQHGRLFNYMVAISGYLSSPLSALFLLSMFWKRTTESGAFCGLVVGHVLGIARLVAELVHPEPACGMDDDRPTFLRDVHYLYFVQIQLVCTLLVTVILSLLTTPRQGTELSGVTWWTRQDVEHNRKEMVETNKLEANFYADDATKTFQVNSRSALEHRVKETQTGESVKTENRDVHGENEIPVSVSLLDHVTQDETGDVKACCWRLAKNLAGTNDEHVATITQDSEAQKIYLTQDRNASNVLNLLGVMLMLTVAFLTGFYR